MSFDNESLTHDQPQTRRTATVGRLSTRIFYGWRVVLSSATGLFWGVLIIVYSFSVLFKPPMQEFHTCRRTVSLAFIIKFIAAALCAAPIGWLTDRHGARLVILTSTAIFASLLLARRQFSCSMTQFYCFYATEVEIDNLALRIRDEVLKRDGVFVAH